MRAYRVHEHGEPEILRLDDLPDLTPGEGEVRVDVRAVGLNYPDLLVVQGKYQLLPQRPFIPGKDFAGVVAAVGPDVLDVRVGDRVMSQVEYGAFAQQVLLPAARAYRMPDSMSFTQGAAMGLVYPTAHTALVDRARLAQGETVLVGGANGGVGLAAVQVAKWLGAVVVAGVRGDDAARAARAAGADFVIDLTQPDLRNAIREQVHALPLRTPGVDVVIDPLGGDFFAGAIRALNWCGRLVVVGFASGTIPTVKANYLLLKNIAVMGIQWSDYRTRIPAQVAAVQQALFDGFESGALSPQITVEAGFEALPRVLAALGRGEVRGKAVITLA